MRRDIFQHLSLLAITALLGACPQDPEFLTTDGDASGTSTTAEAMSSTGADATSTGDDPTTTTTGDASTGTPIGCGEPAAECVIIHREWCVDLGDLCDATPLNPAPGSGSTNYCELVEFQCADKTPPCQVCNYIAGTCKQLGGGADVCDAVLAECLCRAQAHDIPII